MPNKSQGDEPRNGQHEFFLSYSHLDNEPLIKGQEGWVSSFHSTLKVRLGQLLGDEPDTWFDLAKLRDNDLFAAVIGRGAAGAAVLIPVLSPAYKKSEWCEKELQEFCDAAERAGGLRIDHKSRIFKVIKTPIPREDQPIEIRDTVGYLFFYRETKREFRLDEKHVDQAYLLKIDDLAQDIKELLTRMKEIAAREAGVEADAEAAERPAADDEVKLRDVIYVAESTSDLVDQRDRIVRFLKQRGYRVVPDEMLPRDSAGLRRAVRDYLAEARLSIHLVGERYGSIPEGEQESDVMIQNELAAERSADPTFSRLIWMPQGLKTDDERQRAFLEELRRNPEAQAGAEILPVTLVALETEVQAKLAAPAAQSRPTEEPAKDATLRYLYLLCDRRDRLAGEKLRDEISERDSGVVVKMPLFDEDDEKKFRPLHQGNIETCDGVLLLYGAAKPTWLEMMLLELRRYRPSDRPFKARAIHVFGDAAESGYRTREAPVVTDHGAPRFSSLRQFLIELRS